jgi:hypothetical protein
MTLGCERKYPCMSQMRPSHVNACMFTTMDNGVFFFLAEIERLAEEDEVGYREALASDVHGFG